MTLNDLIELLTDLREDGADGETEVSIGYQPSYPLENELEGVALVDADTLSLFDPQHEDHGNEDPKNPPADKIILCAAESTVGYGSKWWWDAAENV